MPDKDQKNDKSTKKKDEAASAAPAPAAVPPEDSEGKETHQFPGNDPAVVHEAAKRAEMAISDADKAVARAVEAMKTPEAVSDA